MRIIGIDPGLCKIGFSIIDFNVRNIYYISSGTILLPKYYSIYKKLRLIFNNIDRIISNVQPNISTLEIVFSGFNKYSNLMLCHSRGVILLALIKKNLIIFEYTALQIKKIITGNGKSKKKRFKS